MRVVVIGAGVLGASVAYHLAHQTVDVTVVDCGHNGRATAAGAGIICPWAADASDPTFYQLYTAGARYYAELVPALAELGETDFGFRRVGALIVSTDSRELAAAETMLRQRQPESPEMGELTRLSPCEAIALFPPLRADFAALGVGGGARVDGRRLAAALLRVAQHRGAAIRHAEAQILASGDRIIGVQLPSETLAADRVVVAAGAWAPALLRPLRLALPVEPQRGQIVHLQLPGYETQAWPVILPPGSHYLVPFDDSRVVVGATREHGTGFDDRVTAAGQAEVLSEALRVAPGLGPATMIETRVGFRPMGPDIRPLLGTARGLDGLVIGNGLGAAGLTIGPFAGKLLADVVLGWSPAVDLAAFDPLRHRTTAPPQAPFLR